MSRVRSGAVACKSVCATCSLVVVAAAGAACLHRQRRCTGASFWGENYNRHLTAKLRGCLCDPLWGRPYCRGMANEMLSCWCNAVPRQGQQQNCIWLGKVRPHREGPYFYSVEAAGWQRERANRYCVESRLKLSTRLMLRVGHRIFGCNCGAPKIESKTFTQQ